MDQDCEHTTKQSVHIIGTSFGTYSEADGHMGAAYALFGCRTYGAFPCYKIMIIYTTSIA